LIFTQLAIAEEISSFLLPLFQVDYHITKKPLLIMWDELLVVSGQPVALCE
jgi:hypothetical protein